MIGEFYDTRFSRSFETSEQGNTALKIFIQDQTTPTLQVPFLQERAVVSLASDTAIGDRTVELAGGHGAVVGEILEMAVTGGAEFMQSEILAVVSNTITVDQPVNRIYTTAGTTALRSTEDLLVDGSSVPQIFSVLPLPSQSGDMVRIIIEMRGGSGDSLDFSTFGSGPALVNGCVLRVKNQDGTFKNLFNFKSNGDFIKQAYDHVFLEPRIGNTIGAFTSRLTWGGQSKHGVIIRLDGSLGQELQVVIQDNITEATHGNTLFNLMAQGHEIQN